MDTIQELKQIRNWITSHTIQVGQEKMVKSEYLRAYITVKIRELENAEVV